ncbi:MAG: DUF6515 family protein, partial [Sphaerospermopsis kisseleviana]
PTGARVPSLPEGFIRVNAGSQTYYYYLGTFYRQDAATGNYVVINPPSGAVVPYLPGDATRTTVNGTEYYVYGNVYYRPYYVEGQLVYEVAAR